MPYLPQLTKEHLIALLKQFKSFPHQHRDNCWRFLLALPCNEERFQDQVRQFKIAQSQNDPENSSSQQLIFLAKNLTFTLDKAYPISSYTLKNRIHKVALALYRWSPSLAQCPWLPKFIFPFIKFYNVSTVSAFETCCVLLKSLEQFFIFRNFMSNRELFIINQIMCEWFVLPGSVGGAAGGYNVDKSADEQMAQFFAQNQQNLPLKNLKSQQEFVFNLFSSFFTEQLQGDDWLKLVDHILTNGKIFFVYILMALFCGREMDLRFRDKIDNKVLDLHKIDHLLRAAYIIYHSFNPKQSLDIYDDLIRVNQAGAVQAVKYDDFDRTFPVKQLAVLSHDYLPEEIIMPDMRIRDVKAEVDDVSTVFREKYGKGSQHNLLESQRRKDEELLERASYILENSRTGQGGALKKYQNANNSDRKAEYTISFGEASVLGNPNPPAAQQPNGSSPHAQREPAIDINELTKGIAAEQLAQPAPPARYSRQNDQDLKEDQLTVPERPLTQAEIRRNVAKYHANQQIYEKMTLQRKLQEIEKDYNERRTQHRAVSDRKVKADVDEADGLQEWGSLQPSDRIGSSVGATVRSRIRGVRVSKTQSGLNQESSTVLKSQDGVVNYDDLYSENDEEKRILDQPHDVLTSARMASTDVRSRPVENLAKPKPATIKTYYKQSQSYVQRYAKPGIAENAKKNQQTEATADQQPAANAFKRDSSQASVSKISASKTYSQPTPSIMKSSSSKTTSSSVQNERKFPPRYQRPGQPRQIPISSEIRPAKRDDDLVKQLIDKHKLNQNTKAEKPKDADFDEQHSASEHSRLTNSPIIEQHESESSLLNNADLLDDFAKELQVRYTEQQTYKKQFNPESPRVYQLVARKSASSKSVSYISSTEQPGELLAIDKQPNMTEKEIDNLPVSDAVKRKLYDLQSFHADAEESAEIQELASAQNQEYLNILNNDSFNVEEKISHLISQIKQNSAENHERMIRQRVIDEQMRGLAADDNGKTAQQLIPETQTIRYKQLPANDVFYQFYAEDQYETAYANTVYRLVLPPSIDSKQIQKQADSHEASDRAQQRNAVRTGNDLFGQQDCEDVRLEHPEDIIVSSMTQTTDSQNYLKQDIKIMLNERKLQDGSFGQQSETSASYRPINTATQEEYYREYIRQQPLGLPTQEELVQQIGSIPQYRKDWKSQSYEEHESSSYSIMTPAKVVSMEKRNVYNPQSSYSAHSAVSASGKQAAARLAYPMNPRAPSDANDGARSGSSGSLPPPSKSQKEDLSSSGTYEHAIDLRKERQNSSLSDSDKKDYEVQQIINQYLHPSSHGQFSADSKLTQQSELEPASSSGQSYHGIQPLHSQKASEHTMGFQTTSSLPYPEIDARTIQKGNADLSDSGSYPDRATRTQNAYQFFQQKSPTEEQTRSSVQASASIPDYHGHLPPRAIVRQDESAISAVNTSKVENVFRNRPDASSSFDDLDYQQARYGTKISSATAQSSVGVSAGMNTGGQSGASQSETSQSNFSTYLKNLQYQTKALEEKLNLPSMSGLMHTTARDEDGVRVFTSKLLKEPQDVSVYSNATSTISGYDSDPESFIDSVKMAVQAAHGMRQESDDFKQGLRGMFEEVYRELDVLESQLSSSQ